MFLWRVAVRNHGAKTAADCGRDGEREFLCACSRFACANELRNPPWDSNVRFCPLANDLPAPCVVKIPPEGPPDKIVELHDELKAAEGRLRAAGDVELSLAFYRDNYVLTTDPDGTSHFSWLAIFASWRSMSACRGCLSSAAALSGSV